MRRRGQRGSNIGWIVLLLIIFGGAGAGILKIH